MKTVFIDSSKTNLKIVLFHNGNKDLPVNEADVKESYENINFFSNFFKFFRKIIFPKNLSCTFSKKEVFEIFFGNFLTTQKRF